MLRIYSVALELVRRMRAVVEAIAVYDRDMADQLRRSLRSIVLNIAEGGGAYGGNQRLRYASALGSSRESLANAELAAALGYVDELDAETRNMFDHVIGTLVRCIYR